MDHVTDIKECLNKNLSHEYQFTKTGEGSSQWRCRLCGDFVEEFEDCSL